MSREKILEIVKDFILKERWNYNFEITETTSVQEDLQVYGDDAHDFLLQFCKSFDIDTKNFKADEFFKPEPGISLSFSKDKEYKSFTVKNLIDSFVDKKLG